MTSDCVLFHSFPLHLLPSLFVVEVLPRWIQHLETTPDPLLGNELGLENISHRVQPSAEQTAAAMPQSAMAMGAIRLGGNGWAWQRAGLG